MKKSAAAVDRQFRLMCLPLLFLFVGITGLLAQEADLGEIQVTASLPKDRERPEEPERFSTIIVIDDQQAHKNVAQILDDSPEVLVKESGSEAGISTVSIRGSSSKNVLVLMDGLPLNSAGNSSFDISMIPAEAVERIEIIRGGNAALHGSGAMGGVINIITNQGDRAFYKITAATTPFRSAKASFSTGLKGQHHKLFFSALQSFDKGNFAYLDSNGTEFNPDDDQISRREHNEASKTSFVLNNEFIFANSSFLGVLANYHQKQNEIGGPVTFENHFEHAWLETRLLNLGVRYNLGNSFGLGTGEFSVHYKLDSYDYRNPQEYGGSAVYSSRDLHYLEQTNHLQLFFPAQNIIHLITETSIETTMDIAQRIQVAGIIRDELFLSDGRLGFFPSLRLQYNSDSQKKLNLLGNLGMSAEISQILRLKLNGFRAFRSPDFSELHYTYGQYVGNPNLLPEISWGGDAGLQLDLNFLFIEAVGFLTYYENLIQYLLSYGFIYKPMNIDEVISYGAELRAELAPWESLKLQGGYTYNAVGRLADYQLGTPRQLPGHPLNAAYASVGWTVGPFELGGILTFQDYILITSNGLKFIPPAAIVDIFLRAKISNQAQSKTLSLFIEAANVGNVMTYDIRNYPLEGFKLTLGAEFDF
ncbi:MAG: TonB-dependent receptor [Spirochaetaceae bacterium]|nr:MAG: TonB-dependent receptor [Spirochaetaceae bacterium]